MQKKTIQFNNIFSRLLFFNIILILVATILPQIVLYNYFINQYRKKLEEANYENILQVRDFVDESIFERLVMIPVTHFSDITSNNILISPIDHNIRDQSYDILKISEKLYAIQSAYPFVSKINVYYPFNDLLFRGSNVFFLNSNSPSWGLDVPWLKENVLSEDRLSWNGITDSQTAFVYTRSIPYFDTSHKNKAMLAIEVDKQALVRALEKTRSSNNGFCGIVAEDGKIIVNSIQEGDTQQPDEAVLKKLSTLSKDGFFKLDMDGGEFIVAYADARYNDWKYVSLVSIDDAFSGLFDMKLCLAVLCISFIGINIFFSFLITKKAHSPMEYIVNNIRNYGEQNNYLGAEKNQYQLLENTFHNLTFEVRNLNEHLLANQPIIYHNMIKRILRSKDQHIYRDAEIIDFKESLFACFVMKILHPSEMNIHNKMLVNYSIIDLLNSKKTWYNIYSITDENDLIYGIINFSDENNFKIVITDIFENLKKSILTPFCLCMGNIVYSEDDIAASYQDAVEVKKYSFFHTDAPILYCTDINIAELKSTGNAERLLEKIGIELHNGEWECLRKTVEDVISMVSSNTYTADYGMNTLTDLVFVVRKAVIGLGYDEVLLFGGDIREHMKYLTNINEFREWVNCILDSIVQVASDKKENSVVDLKNKIEEYVQTMIFDDLTLSKISEHLYISPSYLSRIFKPIMGLSCSEYLIQVKLDKAMELLENTDYTVNEISEKLGYASTAHFIKIFKKRFGTTPKQRQKMGFDSH